METIGVETIPSRQIRLVKLARETVGVRAQLLALIGELPDNTLEEVKILPNFYSKNIKRKWG